MNRGAESKLTLISAPPGFGKTTLLEAWLSADPALPLARLRARGEFVDIRAADLRFTPGETAAFSGDDRSIVDNVVEEVLLRQPEQVRSFLLETSIHRSATGRYASGR